MCCFCEDFVEESYIEFMIWNGFTVLPEDNNIVLSVMELQVSRRSVELTNILVHIDHMRRR